MGCDGSSLSLSVHPGNEKLHIQRLPLGVSFSRCDSPVHFLVVMKEEERGMCPQNSSSRVWIHQSWQVGQDTKQESKSAKDGRKGTERRQCGHFPGWAAADRLGRRKSIASWWFQSQLQSLMYSVYHPPLPPTHPSSLQ